MLCIIIFCFVLEHLGFYLLFTLCLYFLLPFHKLVSYFFTPFSVFFRILLFFILVFHFIDFIPFRSLLVSQTPSSLSFIDLLLNDIVFSALAFLFLSFIIFIRLLFSCLEHQPIFRVHRILTSFSSADLNI